MKKKLVTKLIAGIMAGLIGVTMMPSMRVLAAGDVTDSAFEEMETKAETEQEELDTETVPRQEELDTETVSTQEELDTETVSTQEELDAETVPTQGELDAETMPEQEALDAETVSTQEELDTEAAPIVEETNTENTPIEDDVTDEETHSSTPKFEMNVTFGDVNTFVYDLNEEKWTTDTVDFTVEVCPENIDSAQNLKVDDKSMLCVKYIPADIFAGIADITLMSEDHTQGDGSYAIVNDNSYTDFVDRDVNEKINFRLVISTKDGVESKKIEQMLDGITTIGKIIYEIES